MVQVSLRYLRNLSFKKFDRDKYAWKLLQPRRRLIIEIPLTLSLKLKFRTVETRIFYVVDDFLFRTKNYVISN